MAEAPEIAKVVYEYFSQLICPIGMDSSFNVLHLEDEKFRDILIRFAGDFLSLVDTGINKLRIVENKELDIKLPDEMPEEMKRRILAENRFSFKFEHDMEGGECADIDIENESAGTRRLFELTPALLSGFYKSCINY